jgi:sugar/nucleoside kinase (ribokinase family)
LRFSGLSALSRLGFSCKLLTVIGDDEFSSHIIKYCQQAEIDISLSPRIPTARTPTSYIIVDSTSKTRTIIHSPTQFELTEDHGMQAVDPLQSSSIALVYLDGRNPQCALKVAQWAQNHRIPILLDAERPRGSDFDNLIRSSRFCRFHFF